MLCCWLYEYAGKRADRLLLRLAAGVGRRGLERAVGCELP
jgi:hypothetical protein